MAKARSLKTWKRVVWELFSQYIRRRDSYDGYVYCITCSKRVPWKEAHAGHFIHGKYPGTWLHLKNVHGQCSGCNTYRDGARDVYALKLIQRYGDGIIEELFEAKRKSPQTLTISFLKEKHEEITQLLAEVSSSSDL